MKEHNFKKCNLVSGWIIFIISFCVYSMTVAPSTSFWDVGEYIATASKLQVGHPPGAPFFQMIGAFSSVFVSDLSDIAYAINMISALSSAFTVMFLFWSIILLLKKIYPTSTYSINTVITLIGSGLVGAVGFAFTDSFWFNAVEAEVYAMATLVLSLLFYVGLLWERDMFFARGIRWLLLISLIIGLSSGIHFMGLLSIPALVLLFYFKNFKKITWLNFVVANITAVIILLFIFKILFPYTLSYFGTLEIFLVNTFGLPFHSGTAIAGLMMIIVLSYTLYLTQIRNLIKLNTALLSISFILIGFSCWIMIPIRANAGTVINENNPDNARELLSYYNLEQYAGNPLLYGPLYTETYAQLDADNPYTDGKPKYEQDTISGTYRIINRWKNAVQNTEDAHKSVFPRMWNHERTTEYMKFIGVPSFSIKKEYRSEETLIALVAKFRKEYASGKRDTEDYHQFLKQFGHYLAIKKPDFIANLSFFFEYQLGYMYWRYFMWNFVGRQNDTQGKGSILHGNWLSGIKSFDVLHLGSQDSLPTDMLANKSRNTYYFLPLLLGLIGFLFHWKRDKNNCWVLFVFFMFTGIALKIYLNEKPYEVRERDYALVGSFYVFAIWIGIGVYALIYEIGQKIQKKWSAPLLVISCFIAVPLVLISQNWDDHDRSNQHTARASAKNYLSSCDKNAILFTIGDNDTFPLWYIQEIEAYRTDIKLVCTTLLATDWYIDQMKTTAYKSKPIPSQLSHQFYKYGSNDVIYYKSISKNTEPVLIDQWMQWIQSDDPRTKEELKNGETVHTFPSKKIRIPVDKEAVLKNGIVDIKDADMIVPYIDIDIKSDYLLKHRLIMLDIIANNNWERPIYFSGGSFGDDDYIWMKEFLQLDGLVYKLVPIKTALNPRNPYEYGRINTEVSYPIIKDWDWGNGEDPTIYRDPETRKNGITYRSSMVRLSNTLIDEGDVIKAMEILDLAMRKMPIEFNEYYVGLFEFVDTYYRLNEKNKARNLWSKLVKKYQEHLLFYSHFTLEEQYQNAEKIVLNIKLYKTLIDQLSIWENENFIDARVTKFNNSLQPFSKLYLNE